MDLAQAQRAADRSSLIAAVSVVVALGGATVFAAWRMTAIDEEVEWMTAHSEQAARSATRARTELRGLVERVDWSHDFAMSSGSRPPRAIVAGTIEALEERLPFCASSDPAPIPSRCAGIAPLVKELEGVVQESLAADDASDHDRARSLIYSQVHPLADRIDDALRAVAGEERNVAARHAARIAGLRHRAPWIPFLPDVLGIGTALVAVVLVRRATLLRRATPRP